MTCSLMVPRGGVGSVPDFNGLIQLLDPKRFVESLSVFATKSNRRQHGNDTHHD